MARYNEVLPAVWSHNNPVDIIGDAEPARYAKALEIAAADPAADGMLVILTPQAMTDPTETARALTPYAPEGQAGACFVDGRPRRRAGRGAAAPQRHPHLRLSRHGRAHVQLPVAFVSRTSARCMRRPRWPSTTMPCHSTATRPRAIIDAVRAEGRTILTEDESKHVLAAYGIPITETVVATTVDDAVAAAERIGYPVVLKLFSRTITHKTDVGGVHLNLSDAGEVRDGVRVDPSIGD